MAKTGKPRSAQITKTGLDLTWYMSLTIVVLYMALFIVFAFMKENMVLRGIYALSGLRIGFTIDGAFTSMMFPEHAGSEATVFRGSFAPFLIEYDGLLLWMGVLAAFIQFGLLLYLLFNLRRFVQTIIDGTPFVVKNRTRLRNIGKAISIAFLILTALAFTHEYYFVSMVEAGTIDLIGGEALDLQGSEPIITNIWMLFVGFFCMVISEAFGHGADLQAEQDLTV